MITSKPLHTILLLLFSMLALTGKAQTDSTDDKPVLFPKLFGLNNSASVGLLGGAMDKLNYGFVGINASLYGVYVDFMGWPQRKSGSENITIDDVSIDVQQHRSQLAAHIGYQIPFHKYQDGSIRLVPVIGLVSTSVSSESSTTISGTASNYHATATGTEFDYGGVLVFQNWDKHVGYFNFSLGITRYTAWIGFGVDFRLGKSK